MYSPHSVDVAMVALEKLPPGLHYVHRADPGFFPLNAAPPPHLSDLEHAALLALVLERGVARRDELYGGVSITADYGGGTLTLQRTGDHNDGETYDVACLVHWPSPLPKYYHFGAGQPVCWVGEDPAEVWRVERVSDGGRAVDIEPITVDDASFRVAPGYLVKLDDEGEPRLPDSVPPLWSDRPSPALLRVAERAAGRLPPGYPIPIDPKTVEDSFLHVEPYVGKRELSALVAYLRSLGETATDPDADPSISAYIAGGQLELSYNEEPIVGESSRHRGFITFWPYTLPEKFRFYVNQPVHLIGDPPGNRWRVLKLEKDGFFATIGAIGRNVPQRRLAVGYLRAAGLIA